MVKKVIVNFVSEFSRKSEESKIPLWSSLMLPFKHLSPGGPRIENAPSTISDAPAWAPGGKHSFSLLNYSCRLRPLSFCALFFSELSPNAEESKLTLWSSLMLPFEHLIENPLIVNVISELFWKSAESKLTLWFSRMLSFEYMMMMNLSPY